MTTCSFCGKEFETRKKAGQKAKYCSAMCRGRMGYSKRKQKIIPYIFPKNVKNICQKCSTVFMGVRLAKYCSRECYLKRNLFTTLEGVILKKCTECKERKPANKKYYHHHNRNADGYSSICKTCNKEKHKQWRNTERGRILIKEERKRNIETLKKYRERTKSARREAENIRQKTDPSFALKNRVRILMYITLRKVKNGRKWQGLVGYSIEKLKRHLERNFKEGMTWEKFMAGEIHIDHVIPVSAFNFTKPEDIDFKKCWAMNNLMPMWARDNLSKGIKVLKPFQPALAMPIHRKELNVTSTP